MKKTTIIIVLLLIIPIVYAGGYNEYASIGWVTNNFCSLFGCTMQGNIDMGGYSIINATFVNAIYTNISINSTQVTDPIWVNRTGDTMSGDLNMSNQAITNIDSLQLNGSTIYGWEEVNETNLDLYCNTDGKILKRVGGTWVCADDEAGSTATNALNYTKTFDGVDKVTLSFYIPA